MIKNYLLAIALFVMAFVSSCSFNADEVKPAAAKKNGKTSENALRSDEEVAVVNGRLYFRDMAALESSLKTLVDAPAREQQAWENNLGHRSLRAKYEAIENSSDEQPGLEEFFDKGTLLCVPDRAFATILNEEGVFQVGEEIHVITQYEEYVITDGDERTLEEKNWDAPNVKRHEILFKSEVKDGGRQAALTDKKAEQNLGGPFFGWRRNYIYTNTSGQTLPSRSGKPTRMKASQWNVSYLLYSSVGIRTKYQYRKRASSSSWRDFDVTQLGLSGEFSGTMYVAALGGPVTVSYPFTTVGNDNTLSKTLSFAVGTGVWFSVGQLNSTHRAVYSGATAQTSM